MAKPVKGNKVHLHFYLSHQAYDELASHRDPYEDRWESALVRRVIHEWLASHRRRSPKA